MTSHLRLLGPVQLLHHCTPTHNIRRKSLALLAYLVTEGRPIARDALADLFWPDAPLAKARRNLSWTLSNLSAALAKSLAADQHAIWFVEDQSLVVDILQVAHLMNQTQVTNYQQLVTLMRGTFMDGFVLSGSAEFENWVASQQLRWQQCYQQIFRTWVAAYRAEQRIELAIAVAQQWSQTLPWDEEAYRQSMTLLAANGEKTKALKEYENCRHSLCRELDVEPGAETTALFHQIRSEVRISFPAQQTGQPAQPRQTTSALLPRFLTPFIGRRAELAALLQLVSDPAKRLITLVGLGGAGKTRLAVAAAERLYREFDRNVGFVSFADVAVQPLNDDKTNEISLISVMADALAMPATASTHSLAKLQAFLAEHFDLVVIDNFEHLTAASPLLLQLLSAVPKLTLLVTSRQPLDLMAEFVVQVHGLSLPVPGTWATALESESVQLFWERVQHMQSDLPIDDRSADEIIRLCRLVEGIPLAIELLVPLFLSSPHAHLRTLLRSNPQLLATTRLDVPPRQRSMRTIFEHSLTLLANQERDCLACCACFKNPFSAEMIVAMVDNRILGEETENRIRFLHAKFLVEQLLFALVRRSLLKRMEGGYYAMHPLFQQFAREELEKWPLVDAQLPSTQLSTNLKSATTISQSQAGTPCLQKRLNNPP